MGDINTWGVKALLRAWDFVGFFANPSHSVITKPQSGNDNTLYFTLAAAILEAGTRTRKAARSGRNYIERRKIPLQRASSESLAECRTVRESETLLTAKARTVKQGHMEDSG